MGGTSAVVGDRGDAVEIGADLAPAPEMRAAPSAGPRRRGPRRARPPAVERGVAEPRLCAGALAAVRSQMCKPPASSLSRSIAARASLLFDRHGTSPAPSPGRGRSAGGARQGRRRAFPRSDRAIGWPTAQQVEDTMAEPSSDRVSALLETFAAAVAANDGPGLAALFTADGVYDDEFFGAHRGRPAIAAMLQRFHDTGRDYLWEFLDPLADGTSAIPVSASAMPRASPGPRAARSCSRASAVSACRAAQYRALSRGLRPRRRAGATRLPGGAHPPYPRQGRRGAERHPRGGPPSRAADAGQRARRRLIAAAPAAI